MRRASTAACSASGSKQWAAASSIPPPASCRPASGHSAAVDLAEEASAGEAGPEDLAVLLDAAVRADPAVPKAAADQAAAVTSRLAGEEDGRMPTTLPPTTPSVVRQIGRAHV